MPKSDFVTVSLNEYDLAFHEEVLAALPLFADGIEHMVAMGFKVSVSPDRYGTGVGVFWTDKDENSKNTGLCLSSWGGSIASAWKKGYLVVVFANEHELSWTDAIEELKERAKAKFYDWLKTNK